MVNNPDTIDSDFLKFSNNDISKYIGINDNNKKNYSQIDKTKKKIIKWILKKIQKIRMMKI